MLGRSIILIAALLIAALAAAFSFFFLLSGRLDIAGDQPADADFGPPMLAIESLRFADIPDWGATDPAPALGAFRTSCTKILALSDDARANPVEALGPGYEGFTLSGAAGDWKQACRAAPASASPDGARRFFERHFTPVAILNRRTPGPDAPAGVRERRDETGLFTGYFEPLYAASAIEEGRFTAPLLARPEDLVMVDLGRFRESLAGERIAGFVEAGQLRPYPDHAAINAGALGPRMKALAWLDPNDLFFLQIQGSGRLDFGGVRRMRVGYDGQNGRPYTAIGKPMIERGVLSRENVSMQTIRAWLDSAPADAAQAMRERNESYVFFREITEGDPQDGPIGAQGAPLAAGASLAVDRRYHAMGLPVFLSFQGEDARFSGLYIAQDTGGAIRGPVRGDIFVGTGAAAGEVAGTLQAQGRMIALIPRPVAARAAPSQ